MNKRKTLRQRQTVRTKLRLTMVSATVAASGLVLLLIIVFNLAREEESRAHSAMTYRSATCIQETSPVLRGSINQQIIGVVIETSGKGQPVKLNALTFSARGTSAPITRNVENARLWYTSGNNGFNLDRQIGNTVVRIDEKNFTIACQLELIPGKNYFWLTMDIKPDAEAKTTAVDAACTEIRIGAISYLPAVSDPEGKRFMEANIPYYSMGNLALGKTTSWNSKRDGSGAMPRSLYDSRNSYFIQAGHRMISSSGSNLQTLVIEKGGELKIISPLRINTLNVTCGGVLLNDYENKDYLAFNYFSLENGAMYIHNNKGLLPGYSCRFEPASGFVCFNYGKGTLRPDVSYGNLTLDLRNTEAIDLSGCLHNILGDFEIRSTGPGGITFSQGDSLQIGGNLVITGGTLAGSHTGNWYCRLQKDLIIKGGALQDASRSSASSCMDICGDIMLLSGKVMFNKNGTSCMRFTGPDESRWMQRNTCEVKLGNVELISGKVVRLKGDNFGQVSKGACLTVAAGASLLCGQAVVSGAGTFVLDNKATLGVGHPEGIWSDGNKGNIQTAKRVYKSGAAYMYYTSSQPQQTGVFSTTPDPNQVFRLVINKDFPSQAVVLSQDIRVEERCLVSLGDIRENGFRLTLPDGQSSGLN